MSRLDENPISRSTFDLHPQTLTIEAILKSQLVALHRLEPLEEVFVGPAPTVVHTHGIVGRDRAIDERPAGHSQAKIYSLFEGVRSLPVAQNLMLKLNEIDLTGYRIEDGHLGCLQLHNQTLVDRALALVVNDMNPSNFAGVAHMRPPIGLQVEALDLDHPNFLNALRKQVDFGADQVRDRESLLPGQNARIRRGAP